MVAAAEQWTGILFWAFTRRAFTARRAPRAMFKVCCARNMQNSAFCGGSNRSLLQAYHQDCLRDALLCLDGLTSNAQDRRLTFQPD